jgi:hypothetical protein
MRPNHASCRPQAIYQLVDNKRSFETNCLWTKEGQRRIKDYRIKFNKNLFEKKYG